MLYINPLLADSRTFQNLDIAYIRGSSVLTTTSDTDIRKCHLFLSKVDFRLVDGDTVGLLITLEEAQQCFKPRSCPRCHERRLPAGSWQRMFLSQPPMPISWEVKRGDRAEAHGDLDGDEPFDMLFPGSQTINDAPKPSPWRRGFGADGYDQHGQEADAYDW